MTSKCCQPEFGIRWPSFRIPSIIVGTLTVCLLCGCGTGRRQTAGSTVDTATAAKPPVQPEVVVAIEQVSQNDGTVHVALFSTEESFTSRTEGAFTQRLPAARTGTVARWPAVPPGTYAAAAFHDLNDNGQLDRNLLGIPTEPYAFSGMGVTDRRPPAFDQAAFEVDGVIVKRTLTLR